VLPVGVTSINRPQEDIRTSLVEVVVCCVLVVLVVSVVLVVLVEHMSFWGVEGVEAVEGVWYICIETVPHETCFPTTTKIVPL
jgi:hypothetical protein